MIRRFSTGSTIALLLTTLAATAQTTVQQTTSVADNLLTGPEFEVASIKLNMSGSAASSANGSKGSIVYTNLTLKNIIEQAYTVKPFQVIGPDWMQDVRLDITAKNPPNTTLKDRPAMLRKLLEDRFRLAVHRGSKEMPGYALVVGKKGFRLQQVAPEGGSENESGGRVHLLSAKKMPMASLADFIARNMDQTVIDKTGIEGVYDFELRWVNDDLKSNGDDAAPSLLIALQETLGLRLQAQKVPVEIIMVDHVERVPTGN